MTVNGGSRDLRKTYRGVIVPMITPLTEENKLDEPALRRMIDHVINGGVQGIFMLGTTGEGPSVPRDMRVRIVQQAIEYTGGRAQVYAGIADTVVEESINFAKEYLRRGAAAVIAPLPSYYTLTPDEQFHYFYTLVERVRGPVLLYDIPQAVHQSIDHSVIEHLRAFPNVVGIKDSSGDRDRLTALLNAYSDDPGFSVLVGTTAMASFGLESGADGFVPSAANLNPALCARLYASALKGDWPLTEELQRTLDAVQAEFVGDTLGRTTARLKRLMVKRGLCGPNVFPPLQVEA